MSSTVTTATIFYSDTKRFQGDSLCFGVRFDSQILPQGSVVAGFLKYENGSIQETIDAPYMKPNQEQNWNRAVQYARDILNNGESSIEEEETL